MHFSRNAVIVYRKKTKQNSPLLAIMMNRLCFPLLMSQSIYHHKQLGEKNLKCLMKSK